MSIYKLSMQFGCVVAFIFAPCASAATFSLDLVRNPHRVAKRAVGDVEVQPFQEGQEWYAPVQLGGQTLNLLVDTGSADLWAMSKFMNQTDLDNHKRSRIYDPEKSQTWQALPNQHFDIQYGNGNWGGKGPVGNEVVSIGSVKVTMQIGAANFTQNIPDGVYDGFLGLAFKGGNSIRPVQQPTFMETLQSQLDAPIFAMSFQANTTAKRLDFGFVNRTLYQGDFVTVPVENTTSAWIVDSVSAVAINGTAYNGKLQPMIFDSGGEDMSIDKETAAFYWSQVPGSVTLDPASSYHIGYPCHLGDSLPDLTLGFGSATSKGKKIVIPGRYFTTTYTNWNKVPGMCAAGLVSYPNVTRINAGFPFFNSHYIVFNQSEPSVSFASFPDVQHADASAPSVAVPSGNTPIQTQNSNTTFSNTGANAPTSSSGSGLSAGAIAGIVIIVFVATGLGIWAIIFMYFRRKRQERSLKEMQLSAVSPSPPPAQSGQMHNQQWPGAVRYA